MNPISLTFQQIPVAVQFIPAAAMLIMVPFCAGTFAQQYQLFRSLQESPRWLVSRHRKEEALKNLNRLRTKREVDNGSTVMEIEALVAMIHDDQGSSEGRWIDLVGKRYWKRTLVSQRL
jgi:SP family sugar:H+ symporter-like MFS transporter